MTASSLPQVLGFAWSHWRQHPWALTGITATLIVATTAQVLLPVYAGGIIDAISADAVASPQIDAALTSFGIFIGLATIDRISHHTGVRIWIWLATGIMERLVLDAFHRVQLFSTDWHANGFAGATVRKITRGMWSFDDLGDTLYFGLVPASFVIVGLTAMLANQWPLIGLTLAALLIVYVGASAGLAAYYVAPINRRAVNQDSELGASLADAITCNAVIKAFAAEKREEARLKSISQKWLHLMRSSWGRHDTMEIAQSALLLTMQTSLIGLILWFWSTSNATAGQVTLVITSFFLINGYVRDLGMHFRALQEAVNDMEDLVEFSKHPLDVQDARDAKELVAPAGEVVFEDVGFTYQNQSDALYKDFSLRIAPGEKIALVGASGSGKSTFVKLLQRLYDLDAGRILIDGQDISTVTQTSLRQAISIVPQDPILFHRSLRENIAYCRPHSAQQDVASAAKKANAHAFIDVLPQGYETLVGERGVKLSGGERQRVAIARAFIANAPILVLDEATSSLDSVTEADIQKAISTLTENRTTIMIAHRLSTIRQVDRILVFDKGRIVEQGTHDDLARLPKGVYRSFLDTQREQMI